ncbi:hypothetical protein [Raoultibacter timonensis]|uniref:hypothetical protein n=1 Tax=Raoultibacter timonensis TaxID=1907662 RepID=UPI0026DD6C1F|nr:hypothetical protein [Raoultibacter timonensis]
MAAEGFDMLERVKTNIGLSGNDFHDDTIRGHIAEVQRFLIDGGVDEAVAGSEAAVGAVTRGVSDLWNYGAGGASLSPYFLQAAAQLAYRPPEGGDGDA